MLASLLLALAPAVRADLESLDAELEPIRAAHGLPALAAAVVEGGELVALGAVGRRRIDRDVPVEDGDPWHLGSCTKAMTATWIALLVSRGELAWETTAGEVYADLREAGRVHAGWNDVTLAMLLSNCGGAPAEIEPRLWARLWKQEGSERDQRRALAEALLANAPAYEPASRFVYSNAGFALAAAMAEEVLDAPYEERIARDLFAPLGMTSAGFGAPGTPGEAAAPSGHREVDAEPVAVERGPGDDNPPAIAPAGRVHASLADWARFARLHLRGARGEEGLLLAPEAFARLHEPHRGSYAMGWVVRELEGVQGPALWHNGSNTMWYCELLIVPEEDRALLVATNRGDGAARRAVAQALRRLAERD
jgi:CubicO group peptidase (beta-lactamase class C family)